MNLKEKRRSEEEWVEKVLLKTEFYGKCKKHKELGKNEKNVFCIECNIEICRHCCNTQPHLLHPRLQICKYVYHDVLRLLDFQPYFDCSHIQTYKINGEKAIHLKRRPRAKDARPSTKSKYGASCVTCKRYLQDLPNRFCSISCKISASKKNKFGYCQKLEQSVMGKEECNEEERSLEEKKSNTSSSSLTDVSVDSLVLSSHFSLRPFLRILKRKGISRRSPLL